MKYEKNQNKEENVPSPLFFKPETKQTTTCLNENLFFGKFQELTL